MNHLNNHMYGLAENMANLVIASINAAAVGTLRAMQLPSSPPKPKAVTPINSRSKPNQDRRIGDNDLDDDDDYTSTSDDDGWITSRGSDGYYRNRLYRDLASGDARNRSRRSKSAVWVQPFVTHVTQDSVDVTNATTTTQQTINGFAGNSYGLMMGAHAVQYPQNSQVSTLFGGTVSYAYTDTRENQGGANKMNANSYLFSLYTVINVMDGGFGQLIAGYGLHQFKNKRLTANNKELRSSFRADHVYARLVLGYSIPNNQMLIRPGVVIEATHMGVSEFTEKNDTLINTPDYATRLKVGKLSMNSLKMGGQLELCGELKLPRGWIGLPQLILRFVHDVCARAPRVKATLNGGNSAIILTQEGASPPQNLFDLQLGIGVRTSIVECSIGYLGQFARERGTHGGYLRVSASL